MNAKKTAAFTLGTVMILSNGIPVYAKDSTSVINVTGIYSDTTEKTIENVADLVQGTMDAIEIEVPEPVEEVSYTYVQQEPVYTYTVQETANEPVTMSVEEFLSMYGQEVTVESASEKTVEVETIPADTSLQQAAYDQALVNYNNALAEYEAANQIVETSREVEVEVVEESVDEEGNVVETSHMETQTIIETSTAGDVTTAQANLDAAKAALDAAQADLLAAQNMTEEVVVTAENTQTNSDPSNIELDVYQSDVSEAQNMSNEVLVPKESQESISLNVEETVTEIASNSTIVNSGTCGDNLTWTLDDEGLLTISGTGDMYNYGYTLENCSPWYGKTDIKNVVIEDDVTSIGDWAFNSCTRLTEIIIPDSVTSIGGSAFYGCTSLTEITIPDSVTSIGGYAFWNCTNLTEITIGDSVTSIGDYAFYSCSNLTEITIPDSITSIGYAAFYGCTSLTAITIPDSVSIIGTGAFSVCTSLSEITIPDSVTSIGNYAFSVCTSLSEITIPDSVTSIEYATFSSCTSLTAITIPDSVTSIGGYAFSGCTSLTEITIPDSVTSIGDGAFNNCTSLTLYVYPNSTALDYAVNNEIPYVVYYPVESLVIEDMKIPVGASKAIVYTISPDDCTDPTVIWTSSDDQIASIDEHGIITAKKEGSVIITGTTNRSLLASSCTVQVVIPVDGITLDQVSMTLNKGETATLTAKVTPEDATNTNVTWTSSDENVVTVVDGRITAIGKGIAAITAAAEDGNFIAVCEVTVNVPVSGITLDETSLTLNKGEEAIITATVTPSDASNPNVIWTSSDETVATVNNGVINALSKGTAIITAATEDGSFTAVCEATVNVRVTGITLDETALTLNKGEEATITAAVTPQDATNTNITWASSDEDVVTVVDGKITAIGKGTATITATTEDGSFSAACKVTVVDYEVLDVKHTLSLDGNIGVNFYFLFSDGIIKDESSRVEFTVDGSTISKLIKDGVIQTVGGKEYHRFTVEVNSLQMTSDILAKVFTTNGDTGFEDTYSVKTYCDSKLSSSSTDTKLKNLMTALLNYGGYTQIQFNAHMDRLANADLTDTDVSDVTADMLKSYESVESGSEEGVSLAGSTLTLDSLTTIKHYFRLESGHNIDEYTFILGDEVLTPIKSGSLYYVEIPNIASKDLDTMYTVDVGGFSITYSALSYAYNQLIKTNGNVNLQNACRALYKYNVAADTYFRS